MTVHGYAARMLIGVGTAMNACPQMRRRRGASYFFQAITRSLIASTTAMADWAEPSCQPDKAEV